MDAATGPAHRRATAPGRSPRSSATGPSWRMTSAATLAPTQDPVSGVGGADHVPSASAAGPARRAAGSCPSRRRRIPRPPGAVGRDHPAPLRLEEGELVVATHEWRRPPARARASSGLERQASHTSTGSRLPLSSTGWRSRNSIRRSGELGGEPSAQHLAGAGRLLQAGRHVDGVADDGHDPAGPDRLRHHLARVDADREHEVAAQLAASPGRRPRPARRRRRGRPGPRTPP